MIRIFIVLCFVFGTSLCVRLLIDLYSIGTDSYIKMPLTATAALDEGLQIVERPEGLPEYSSLVMLCPPTDYTICILYDDTDAIAGLQIALEKSRFANVFDTEIQGFTEWFPIFHEETIPFYTIQMFYVSPEYLLTDADTRKATRNPNLILQDDNVYVIGFNGALYNISTSVEDFTTNNLYTRQGCFPQMGQHYFYKMSPSLECEADTLFPWYALADGNQLIGVGLAIFGTYNEPKNAKDFFERVPQIAIKPTIPRAPQCLYDLADSPGLLTLNTYFVNEPQLIKCL